MYIVQMIDGLSVGGAQQLQVTFAREARLRGFKLGVISLSEDDGSPFRKQLEALGVLVYFFPTTRIFDLGNIFRIWQWLRSERPDILHTHLTYSIIIGSIVGLLTGTPVVATLHNTGADQKVAISRTEFAEIFALRHLVSRIIACGPAVAKRFELMIKGKPIFMIPNALDHEMKTVGSPQRFMLKKQITGNADRTLLISVGRLVPQKGMEDLLDAFEILHRSHPAVFLAIAGDGELKKPIEEKIIKMNLLDHVRLLGNYSDIPGLLAASDMFVLSSRWEGLPIAVLEAMAAGLPILVTDVGDNAWALESTGVVVPPHLPANFAFAMAALLNDQVRRHSLGRAAQARLKEYFNPSRWFEDTLSVYNSCLIK